MGVGKNKYLSKEFYDLLTADMLTGTPDFIYSKNYSFQEYFTIIPNVESIKLDYICIGFLEYMTISIYNIEHDERDYLKANNIKYQEDSGSCWSFVYFRLEYSIENIGILNELIKSKIRHYKKENRYNLG